MYKGERKTISPNKLENNIKYSVVIPLYNEEDNVEELYKALKTAMDLMDGSYEIIYINDGSYDRTNDKLKDIQNQDNNLKVIDFRENRGQVLALSRGFKEAKGELIISMDGDLQDDPNEIPKLIQKLNEGFDVVCGWRYRRKDRRVKRFISLAGNLIQRIILNTGLHDISCSLRVYKKSCIKNLRLYRKEQLSYIPYFIQKMGFKITEIPVNHRPRRHGESKYGSSVLFKAPIYFIYALGHNFFHQKKI